MKKYIIFLMIFICVGLFGCAENPALISNNPSSVEKAQSSTEVETEERVIRLPYVAVYYETETESDSSAVFEDVWCWKEEENCSLEPSSPIDIFNEGGWPPLQVKPGEEFSITIAGNDITDPEHLTNPDKIEAIQYKWGEEGKKVDVRNRQITAPTEKGRYYYSLKFQWDGELVGQAYFAFGINVR
ncbi:hypothetical protein [Ornithinibacillus californiensis]|uniref:hypothetical protein n=1 Tax=Ornithinibacillus californiensis TaxID=161536 RepID=UPI00064E038E|nr:hypothetical protein [Ornithinibacillus californiensis]